MSKMSRATRWCPTPEQLIILEELYKGGLRTPKPPLIQKITAHLSLYGKIEGKNVFYWFQNHKARDRQKLRKKLLMSKQLLFEQHHHQFSHEQQQMMNYIQTNPFFYPHPPSNPLPLVGFHHNHHQPQHGSPSLLIHQGMAEDASRVVGGSSTSYYVWKMGDDDDLLPKSCDCEVEMTTTCRHDCVMMVGPTINNRHSPLQTLDLFPTSTIQPTCFNSNNQNSTIANNSSYINVFD